MSRPFFYSLLIIFNIIEFVFFLTTIENYLIGAFLGIVMPIITFLISSITYEVLRKKQIINKKLNIPNKRNNLVVVLIILTLIIAEIIIFLSN